MTRHVGAIVVHHRSYETVGRVVLDLLAEGIDVTDIVVVDNSDDEDGKTRLRAAIPAGTAVLFTSNRGYGAAVNHGVRVLESTKQHDFLVVATHEVRVTPGALSALERALTSDPRVGAAGPTLLTTSNGEDEVWSTGGTRTRLAKVPRHHDHRTDPDELLSRQLPDAVPRQWLDGAFVMYRAAVLSEHRINEVFFMYVEEVDLHLRLGRAGFGIVWVPSSRVHQSSEGTPPFYFGRNLVLLHRLNHDYLALALAPLAVFRAVLPQSIRQRSAGPILDGLRGIGHALSVREAR
ncbi:MULTISPECIES: glycosyltransferase [unclassified Curtobacterium]|uniref:glycosyltransferase n=1 Tax=unclassified Curtobacterium TaxID=257496 RepID=UPI003813A37B